MKSLLGYVIVGVLLAAPVAIYTFHDRDIQAKSFREQCELLTMQYELRRAKEMLQMQMDKEQVLTSPESIAQMKEKVAALECQLTGVNQQLAESAKETEEKIQNRLSGSISDSVAAGLSKVEGKWAAEMDKITGIANDLNSTSDFQKSTLNEVKSLVQRDPEEMEQSMVMPTIQLNGVDTVGSGVLIASVLDKAKGTYANYALTSYHVVRNILAESEGGSKPQIRVNTYDKNGPKEELADIVVFDEDNDMALLKLRTEKQMTHLARVLPRDKAAEIRVFTPIYAVGCPLGNDPIPTTGEIASVKNPINGQNYWMLNAPTYFGNSGGGVYLARTHELIGIFSKIYTHGHGRPVVISHMGLATPIDLVYEWLEKVGYGSLFGQKAAAPTPAAAPKK